MRVGIFARTGSTRESSGASYWGIMDLSGNCRERAVSIGRTSGRNFKGSHGDGNLQVDGSADYVSLAWPVGGNGLGFRGGAYDDSRAMARVSDRTFADNNVGTRNRAYSGRVVRSAP